MKLYNEEVIKEVESYSGKVFSPSPFLLVKELNESCFAKVFEKL